MNTISQKYFLDKLSDHEQQLFHTDPKQFRVLYYKKLATIVKQDILELGQMVTPVYEIDHHSDWYDSWHTDHYWYQIKREFRQNAINLFKTYCSTGCPGSFSDIANQNKFTLESRNKEFFDLLRAVYFYINYNNKKMWGMPNITPLNISSNRDCDIIYSDFVENKYSYETKKKSVKLKKTKSELNKEIASGCEKITDRLIDKEIKRISKINEQIKAAKETLAKYGTELVKGY